MRPDTRFAGNRDHPVTLRDGRSGRREPIAGHVLPRRLDLGEEGGGSDVGEDGVEGVAEWARGGASHFGATVVGRTTGIEGVGSDGVRSLIRDMRG